ncbi:hypothetical protein [Streptomyces sp. NPDC046332]
MTTRALAAEEVTALRDELIDLERRSPEKDPRRFVGMREDGRPPGG